MTRLLLGLLPVLIFVVSIQAGSSYLDKYSDFLYETEMDDNAADGQADQTDQMNQKHQVFERIGESAISDEDWAILRNIEESNQAVVESNKAVVESNKAFLAQLQNINQVNSDKSDRGDSNSDGSGREESDRDNNNASNNDGSHKESVREESNSESNYDYSRFWQGFKWLGAIAASDLFFTYLRTLTPAAQASVEQVCNVAVNVVGMEVPGAAEACSIMADSVSEFQFEQWFMV